MYHRALTGIYSIKARGQHFDSIIANSLLFNTPLSVRLLQLDAKMPPIEIQTEGMLKENALLRRFGCEMKNSKIRMPQFMNADRFKRIIGSIDCVVFDCDGVLWLGENAIPGSAQFVEMLLKANKQVIFLTNNATKSREVYAKKLVKLGYNEKISKQHIVNPAAVVADTLKNSGIQERNKKVYLIGSQGVKDELEDLGIEHFGGDQPDPVENQDSAKDAAFLYDIELEEEIDQVGAVVVGYEKHFNYIKLMKAANYLQKEDCMFVATNEDETCPGPKPNIIIPDAGPLVAAVKTASNREPLVVGKPNSPAFDYICRRWNIEPERTMMVGDRTNTDVKFGRDHGLKTMLVLSGCHQVDDIVQNQLDNRDDMVPDFYAKNLGSLVPQN